LLRVAHCGLQQSGFDAVFRPELQPVVRFVDADIAEQPPDFVPCARDADFC
jgi:hypothetical protein